MQHATCMTWHHDTTIPSYPVLQASTGVFLEGKLRSRHGVSMVFDMVDSPMCSAQLGVQQGVQPGMQVTPL